MDLNFVAYFLTCKVGTYLNFLFYVKKKFIRLLKQNTLKEAN